MSTANNNNARIHHPLSNCSNMSPMAHDMLLHSSGSEAEVNASHKVQMLLKDTFQNSGTNSSQPIQANLLSP